MIILTNNQIITFMKKENRLSEKYEAPQIEALEVRIEHGFAASPSYGGFPDEESWD
jgi:hypothetical protein